MYDPERMYFAVADENGAETLVDVANADVNGWIEEQEAAGRTWRPEVYVKFRGDKGEEYELPRSQVGEFIDTHSEKVAGITQLKAAPVVKYVNKVTGEEREVAKWGEDYASADAQAQQFVDQDRAAMAEMKKGVADGTWGLKEYTEPQVTDWVKRVTEGETWRDADWDLKKMAGAAAAGIAGGVAAAEKTAVGMAADVVALGARAVGAEGAAAAARAVKEGNEALFDTTATKDRIAAATGMDAGERAALDIAEKPAEIYGGIAGIGGAGKIVGGMIRGVGTGMKAFEGAAKLGDQIAAAAGKMGTTAAMGASGYEESFNDPDLAPLLNSADAGDVAKGQAMATVKAALMAYGGKFMEKVIAAGMPMGEAKVAAGGLVEKMAQNMMSGALNFGGFNLTTDVGEAAARKALGIGRGGETDAEAIERIGLHALEGFLTGGVMPVAGMAGALAGKTLRAGGAAIEKMRKEYFGEIFRRKVEGAAAAGQSAAIGTEDVRVNEETGKTEVTTDGGVVLTDGGEKVARVKAGADAREDAERALEITEGMRQGTIDTEVIEAGEISGFDGQRAAIKMAPTAKDGEMPVVVLRKEDGTKVLVTGARRVGAAAARGAKVKAVVLEERDGWTEEKARVFGDVDNLKSKSALSDGEMVAAYERIGRSATEMEGLGLLDGERARAAHDVAMLGDATLKAMVKEGTVTAEAAARIVRGLNGQAHKFGDGETFRAMEEALVSRGGAARGEELGGLIREVIRVREEDAEMKGADLGDGLTREKLIDKAVGNLKARAVEAAAAARGVTAAAERAERGVPVEGPDGKMTTIGEAEDAAAAQGAAIRTEGEGRPMERAAARQEGKAAKEVIAVAAVKGADGKEYKEVTSVAVPKMVAHVDGGQVYFSGLVTAEEMLAKENREAVTDYLIALSKIGEVNFAGREQMEAARTLLEARAEKGAGRSAAVRTEGKKEGEKKTRTPKFEEVPKTAAEYEARKQKRKRIKAAFVDTVIWLARDMSAKRGLKDAKGALDKAFDNIFDNLSMRWIFNMPKGKKQSFEIAFNRKGHFNRGFANAFVHQLVPNVNENIKREIAETIAQRFEEMWLSHKNAVSYAYRPKTTEERLAKRKLARRNMYPKAQIPIDEYMKNNPESLISKFFDFTVHQFDPFKKSARKFVEDYFDQDRKGWDKDAEIEEMANMYPELIPLDSDKRVDYSRLQEVSDRLIREIEKAEKEGALGIAAGEGPTEEETFANGEDPYYGHTFESDERLAADEEAAFYDYVKNLEGDYGEEYAHCIDSEENFKRYVETTEKAKAYRPNGEPVAHVEDLKEGDTFVTSDYQSIFTIESKTDGQMILRDEESGKRYTIVFGKGKEYNTEPQGNKQKEATNDTQGNGREEGTTSGRAGTARVEGSGEPAQRDAAEEKWRWNGEEVAAAEEDAARGAAVGTEAAADGGVPTEEMAARAAEIGKNAGVTVRAGSAEEAAAAVRPDGTGRGQTGGKARITNGAGKVCGVFDPKKREVVLFEGADAATVAHEIGWHAVFDYAKRKSPALYKKMKGFAARAPEGLKKAIRKTYGELREEALIDEIGAGRFEKMMGDKFREILEGDRAARTWWQRVKDWVKDIWSHAKEALGGDAWSEVEEMSEEEAVKYVTGELLRGRQLGLFEGGKTLSGGETRASVREIYTGSAADYDKPSLVKVGTGEGSQVYGWGLYGSNVRGVAEGDSDLISRDRASTPDELWPKYKGKFESELESDPIREFALKYVRREGSVSNALKYLRHYDNFTDDAKEKARQAAGWLETNGKDVSFRDDNITVDHKWVDGEQRFRIDGGENEAEEALKWLKIGSLRVAADAGQGEMVPGVAAAAAGAMRPRAVELLDEHEAPRMSRFIAKPIAFGTSELVRLYTKLTGRTMGSEKSGSAAAKAHAGKAAWREGDKITILRDVFGVVDRTDAQTIKGRLVEMGMFKHEDPAWALEHDATEMERERMESERMLEEQLKALGEDRIHGRAAGGQRAATQVMAAELGRLILRMPNDVEGTTVRRIRTLGDGILRGFARAKDDVERDYQKREAAAFLNWWHGVDAARGAAYTAETLDMREALGEMYGAFLTAPEEVRVRAPGLYKSMVETIAYSPKMLEAYDALRVTALEEGSAERVMMTIEASRTAEAERKIAQLQKELDTPMGTKAERAADWFAYNFSDAHGPLYMAISRARRELTRKLKRMVRRGQITQGEMDAMNGNLDEKVAAVKVAQLAVDRGAANEIRAYLLDQGEAIERAKAAGVDMREWWRYGKCMRIIETQGRAAERGMSVREAQQVLDQMKARLGEEKYAQVEALARMWQANREQHVINDARLNAAFGSGLVEYWRSNVHYVRTERGLGPEEVARIEEMRARWRAARGKNSDDVIGDMLAKAKEELSADYGEKTDAATMRREMGGSLRPTNDWVYATLKNDEAIMKFLERNDYVLKMKEALVGAGVEGVHDLDAAAAKKYPRNKRYGTIAYMEGGKARVLVVPKVIADGYLGAEKGLDGWNWLGKGLHNMLIDWNLFYTMRNYHRNLASNENLLEGMRANNLKIAGRWVAPGVAQVADVALNAVARRLPEYVFKNPVMRLMLGKHTNVMYARQAQRIMEMYLDPKATVARERAAAAAAREGDAGPWEALQADKAALKYILKGNSLIARWDKVKGEGGWLEDWMKSRGLEGFYEEDAARGAAIRMGADGEGAAIRTGAAGQSAAVRMAAGVGKVLSAPFRWNAEENRELEIFAKITAALQQMEKKPDASAGEIGQRVAMGASIPWYEGAPAQAGFINYAWQMFWNTAMKGSVRTVKAIAARPGETLGKMSVQSLGPRLFWGTMVCGGGLAAWIVRDVFGGDEEKARASKLGGLIDWCDKQREAYMNHSEYDRRYYDLFPVANFGTVTVSVAAPLTDEEKLLIPAMDYMSAQMAPHAHDPLMGGGEAARRALQGTILPDLMGSRSPLVAAVQDMVFAWGQNPVDTYRAGAKVYDEDLWRARFASGADAAAFWKATLRQGWNDLGGRTLVRPGRANIDETRGGAPWEIEAALRKVPVINAVAGSVFRMSGDGLGVKERTAAELQALAEAPMNLRAKDLLEEMVTSGRPGLDEARTAKLKAWAERYGWDEATTTKVWVKAMKGWQGYLKSKPELRERKLFERVMRAPKPAREKLDEYLMNGAR